MAASSPLLITEKDQPLCDADDFIDRLAGAPGRGERPDPAFYLQLGPGPWDAKLLRWAYEWAGGSRAGTFNLSEQG